MAKKSSFLLDLSFMCSATFSFPSGSVLINAEHQWSHSTGPLFEELQDLVKDFHSHSLPQNRSDMPDGKEVLVPESMSGIGVVCICLQWVFRIFPQSSQSVQDSMYLQTRWHWGMSGKRLIILTYPWWGGAHVGALHELSLLSCIAKLQLLSLQNLWE